jgi:RNA polymerase sigma-70 factor, ECF subfamily
VRSLLQDKLLNISIPDGADSGSDNKNRSEDLPCLNTENFHDFFIRYSKPVLSFIYAMIQDRSRSEELCQETFVRAFQKLDSRNDHGSPSSWLFGIARNVIREAMKNKGRSLRQVALDDPLTKKLDTGLISADQRLISEELHNRIRNSLAMLTEDQRFVFILKLIHQLKYEEIADITGSSIPKLKVDLHRARLEMRRNLQSYLQGECD